MPSCPKGSEDLQAKRRGFRKVKVVAGKNEIAIYTSPRVADAFEELTMNMALYKGVRLAQVIEAVYN